MKYWNRLWAAWELWVAVLRAHPPGKEPLDLFWLVGVAAGSLPCFALGTPRNDALFIFLASVVLVFITTRVAFFRVYWDELHND